jgi:hypothetical protein
MGRWVTAIRVDSASETSAENCERYLSWAMYRSLPPSGRSNATSVSPSVPPSYCPVSPAASSPISSA